MIESRGHPAPPVPAGFDGSALFDGIHWHQRWEVFEGVSLPGRNDVKTLLKYVGLPGDLTGKRVLDVGAWNGGFSFECERRGASEVVALSLEDPEASGFKRLRAVLGSKVSYALESVYNLDPEVLGQFDVVLFLGVLYHLRYPLLAADKLRSVTSGELFIETHVIDECFITAGRHPLNHSRSRPFHHPSAMCRCGSFIDATSWAAIPATGLGRTCAASSKALVRRGLTLV